jgi:hypothetical protein
MDIPWSGFTKKRKYNPEEDRLQYKDLAGFRGNRLKHSAKSAGQIVKLGHVQSHHRHHTYRSLKA